MTVLVTGSRAITSQELVEAGKINLSGFTYLKHGAARGVDRLVSNWARRNSIKPLPYPAKWDVYGKSAGFKRNQEMIDSGFDVMLAIQCIGKSNGTDHCINQARLTGKPIFLYKENGEYEWLIPNLKT